MLHIRECPKRHSLYGPFVLLCRVPALLRDHRIDIYRYNIRIRSLLSLRLRKHRLDTQADLLVRLIKINTFRSHLLAALKYIGGIVNMFFGYL